ncbi:MAG: EVE domain-containing protein [bacterium]|jgi:predicted RNA-binding protein with PUA-like domain|nr:MAG: EVE domain-containing protein [bacterium]
MPSYWIVKTEPSSYSFGDLERDRRTVWDGVKNAVALKNIRAMRKGDAVMVYHTGDEKQIVGLASVVSDPYPDPKADDDALVVVDVEVGERLPRPVTLAEIKADPDFKDLALVRQGRLSVVPVEERLWKKLLRMGGA